MRNVGQWTIGTHWPLRLVPLSAKIIFISVGRDGALRRLRASQRDAPTFEEFCPALPSRQRRNPVERRACVAGGREAVRTPGDIGRQDGRAVWQSRMYARNSQTVFAKKSCAPPGNIDSGPRQKTRLEQKQQPITIRRMD